MKNKTFQTDLRSKAPPPNGDRVAFSGSIPHAYHRRLVPILFHEYAEDIASRVGPIPGGAVLETAAGTGVVSRRLRATLPRAAALTVSDISADMLSVARETLAGASGVEFVASDATELPFADGSFDVVVCQFGVMFFPDEAKGFREAARVVKPGGRFVFNAWDDLASNPLPGCLHEVFASLSPADPPRFLEKPYRPLELTRMVRDLQRAGFAEIGMTVLPKVCRVTSAADAVEAFLQATPLGVQVAERGLNGAGSSAARSAVAERFAGGDESAPFSVPMRAVVFEATRAG